MEGGAAMDFELSQLPEHIRFASSAFVTARLDRSKVFWTFNSPSRFGCRHEVGGMETLSVTNSQDAQVRRERQGKKRTGRETHYQKRSYRNYPTRLQEVNLA